MPAALAALGVSPFSNFWKKEDNMQTALELTGNKSLPQPGLAPIGKGETKKAGRSIQTHGRQNHVIFEA